MARAQKKRDGARTKRGKLDGVSALAARREAVSLHERSRQLDEVTRELDETKAVADSILQALRNLGVREWSDVEASTSDTVRILGGALSQVTLHEIRLRAERDVASENLPLATEATVDDTWRRLLLERGETASQAARIVGGHEAHVRTAELPPGERRAAVRVAAARARDLKSQLRRLRAEQRNPAEPEHPIFGDAFSHMRETMVAKEIDGVAAIVRALDSRRK